MIHCSVLFLDFDGVLADTMPAKTEVFRSVFAPYGFDPRRLAELYRSHAGLGRDVIFDTVFRQLAGRPITPAERARADEAFAQFERSHRGRVRLFDGVRDFLRRQSARRRLVLITGTPGPHLQGLLARLGIRAYFDAIYSTTGGSSKEHRMIAYLKSRRAVPRDALFAGDSLADMKAAERASVRFVGIGAPAFFKAGDPVLVVPRLSDLEPHLADESPGSGSGRRA